jgi:restriction endonuclease Mrr
MSEAKSARFMKYLPQLLDALRSSDPAPIRPAEAVAWIRARMDVAKEDLTRQVENGRQSIFENDVHWARFYLAKAGLIGKTNLAKHLRSAPEYPLNYRVVVHESHRSIQTARFRIREITARRLLAYAYFSSARCSMT